MSQLQDDERYLLWVQKLEVALAKERTPKDPAAPAQPKQDKEEGDKTGLEQCIREAEKKRQADRNPLVLEKQELLRAKRKQLEEARKAYVLAAKYKIPLLE